MTNIESLDIEKMEHQEALQYVKRFKVLMEINASINSAMDLEVLLRTIIDIAASIMNAEASSLALREASTGELISLVDGNRDADAVWLVGHNPGLEQLVALLSEGRTGDYRGMSPGSVAVLHFPKDAAIEPGVATLVDFWSP